MNKEKVRELAHRVNGGWFSTNFIESIITKWLEQNQPEPVVITVKDLESSTTKYRLIQTEEKLRKAQVELSAIKSQEPVPVGLSDEQVARFGTYYYGDGSECDQFVNDFKFWLKTQTFAQPNQFPQFDEKCKEVELLTKELEQLKSQQFEVNWDGAPDAVKARIIVDYWGKDGHSVRCRDVLAEFERPKPSPQVEVGQIWKCNANEKWLVKVIGITNTKVAFQFQNNGHAMDIVDNYYFTDKFKLVS